MATPKDDVDKKLKDAMHEHLKDQIKVYGDATDKKGKDLLEYRNSLGNRVIDRDLLANYLSLKIAESNYRLQYVVAVFAGASILSVLIQVGKILTGA